VGDEKDFQERVQKIGRLVQELETVADPAARAAAKQLVQYLMDLHGTGLERILEIVFQSGDGGARIIDELGNDPLVSSLLILYGLHPDDLQTRVERKLQQIVSKLHRMGAEARLVGVDGGAVRATVEEEIYNAAPDLTSLVIEGLEEHAASGFVGVEKLLGPSPTPLPQPGVNPIMALTREGMIGEGMTGEGMTGEGMNSEGMD
jgi:hypothetical protein